MSNPTVRRRELANRLRTLRLQAGLTLDEAGRSLEFSAATMSRIENGIRALKVRDVRDLCALYAADRTTTAELIALVEAAKEPGWWEAYSELDEQYATLIGFESAATSIAEHRTSTIPGLLQSSEYQRAYLRDAANPGMTTPFSPEEIVKRVEVSKKRQEILREPTRLTYSAFLDEGCVRRMVGGASTMAGQLRHLMSLNERPHVSIRLIPFSAGAHPGQPGGFCLVVLPQDAVSDVVYVDSLAGQLFLESPEGVDRHRRVVAALSKIALSVDDSQRAFAHLLDTLQPAPGQQ